MNAIEFCRNRAGVPLASTALAAALLLSACSDRDTKLSESVAAAENAATRAEQAAKRAEEAAKGARSATAPAVEEEPADPSEEENADASADASPTPSVDSE